MVFSRKNHSPGHAYFGRAPPNDAGFTDVKPMRSTPFHDVDDSATRR